MVSSGSRAKFSIVFLASFNLVSILTPTMLSKNFARVLLRFLNELPGKDSTGRRGNSALCTLAKSTNGRVASLSTSSLNINDHLSRPFSSWQVFFVNFLLVFQYHLTVVFAIFFSKTEVLATKNSVLNHTFVSSLRKNKPFYQNA